MIKPKFEQPKLITHGTVESITLNSGPHERADFNIFNGSIDSGSQAEGSQNLVCPGDSISDACRKRR